MRQLNPTSIEERPEIFGRQPRLPHASGRSANGMTGDHECIAEKVGAIITNLLEIKAK